MWAKTLPLRNYICCQSSKDDLQFLTALSCYRRPVHLATVYEDIRITP